MNPSALFGADLHIREDQPICRTDDFIQTQIKKFLFIKDICNKYNIPFIVAGDIFDQWKNSPWLLRLALNILPDMICIPGQHDLQGHNLELYDKSSLSVVEEAKKAKVIKDTNNTIELQDFIVMGFPYGIKPTSRRRSSKPIVCLLHTQISDGIEMFETQNGETVLDNLRGYDLIVSGDNHKPFIIESGNRKLINCGSVTRQDANQIDHKPKVYLWDAETNEIEIVEIPIEHGIVVQTHLEITKERDRSLDDYVDTMDQDYSIELNFKMNLESHIAANNVENEIKNKLWEFAG